MVTAQACNYWAISCSRWDRRSAEIHNYVAPIQNSPLLDCLHIHFYVLDEYIEASFVASPRFRFHDSRRIISDD